MAVLARRPVGRAVVGLAAAWAAAVAAGCDPEIVSSTYWCGPELLCPGGQVCNAADGRCVRPDLARPFECPPLTEVGEPDDDLATAVTLALTQCPSAGTDHVGCLPIPTDVDWIVITSPASCLGDVLAVDVRYPAAFAPIVVERMTAEGGVAELAAVCDITGGIGPSDAVCLRTPAPADGVTRLRVTFDDALACGGACDFTHYEVVIGAAP